MSNETGAQWHTRTCGVGSGPPCTCSDGCKAHSQNLLLVEANKSHKQVLIMIQDSLSVQNNNRFGVWIPEFETYCLFVTTLLITIGHF